MKRVVEGSRAVAETVKLCRPNVISAYPITPQTHIVEYLSEMVADGELPAEFVRVESEHSAASVVLGASATGARTYTASTSQGLLLMVEVLYNIAGFRLPVILTCANRSVSAPISIWNDQQDSMAARDTGWIQLYAETNQEASDMHLQAYRIAEDRRVLLPVMICMDGYILTHAYEPIDLLDQKDVDGFLPPYRPEHYLTPKEPLTYGAIMGPEEYTEARYVVHQALERAKGVIEEVAEGFRRSFGRHHGGLIGKYRVEDASTVLVSMGSVVSTIRVAVDEMWGEGREVGVVKVRSFRPFPKKDVQRALRDAENVIVLEKDVSLGSLGALCCEVRSALYGASNAPRVSGFVAGLAGRDISKDSIKRAVEMVEKRPVEIGFLDLREELLGVV